MNTCQEVHPGRTSAGNGCSGAGRGVSRAAISLLAVVLFSLVALTAAPAWPDTAELPLVTVRVQSRPLGEVLAELERKTGYTITFREQWKEHPIEVGFQDRPLDKALKSILADFNHAIFFGPGKQIKIAIFTLKERGGGDAAGSPAYVPPGPNPEEPPPQEEDLNPPPEPTQEDQADISPEEPDEPREDGEDARPGEAQSEAGEGEDISEGQEPDLPPEQSD